MDKLVNSNSIDELEYLGWVIQEGLRFTSPASHATDYEFTQDCQVAGYTFLKDTKITIVMEKGLHHNTA